MRKSIFLSLIFCYIFDYEFVNAQNLDVLKSNLKKEIHDTSRVKILSKIVALIEDDETFAFNLQRKKIAQNNLKTISKGSKLHIFYSRILADSYYIEGIHYYNKSDFDKAFELQQKCLAIYKELKDEAKEADPLSEISKIFTLKGNYKEAIANFYKTLRIYEKYKNYLGVADSYMGLGEIYSIQNQVDKRLESYKMVAKNYILCKQYDGICIAYCEISDCLISQKKYDEADFYLNQAEKYKSYLYNYELGLIALQRGVLADELFQTEKAISFYKQSLNLYELEQEYDIICSVNFLLGRIYFSQKKDSKTAMFHVSKALDLAKKIDFSNEIERSNFLLYEIYKSNRQTEKSLFYLEQYLSNLNEKNSIEIKNTLIQEQLKYEFEKKQLQAKLKSEKKLNQVKIESEKASFQKNVWIISIAALILIVGIFGYFSFRNAKQKKTIAEQKSNILKQKLLVSQMNPHFIFNSLNAIQNCIFKEDGLTAGTYLAQFADLMRMILDFSRKDTISLESEIKLLENYLQLQQFRFNNKFEYKLEIESELNPSQVEIPPMLAQPFIENAIEHGIFHLKEKGLIQISIYKNENNLRFEIEDNGIGLQQSEKLKPKLKTHNSLATIITQERINDLFLDKIKTSQIEIIDLCLENEKLSGVKVIFEIPLKRLVQ